MEQTSIDNIALIRVLKDGKTVGLIPNVEGKKGSLGLYHQFGQDGLNVNARDAILKGFEAMNPELINKSRKNPGKHPNIDLLLHDVDLDMEVVYTEQPNVLESLKSSPSPDQVAEAISLLEKGVVRTAEKVFDLKSGKGFWETQLYGLDCMNAVFAHGTMKVMGESFYDKVPLLTENWVDEDFEAAGVRFIPGSFARSGAYIGSGTTLMPGSIVNTGAYIAGDGVMIDGGARVATAAQVGKGVKLGAGSGLEGVLEPAGMLPTILEDGVRVGANCEIKGIVEEKALIASGTVMASGVKIYDERTGEFQEPRVIKVGDKLLPIPYIPADRVAVSGVYMKDNNIGTNIIRLLEKPASETSFMELPKNPSLYMRNT